MALRIIERPCATRDKFFVPVFAGHGRAVDAPSNEREHAFDDRLCLCDAARQAGEPRLALVAGSRRALRETLVAGCHQKPAATVSDKGASEPASFWTPR